ncbi:hypothetical protein [Planctomicrobium sp. SH527]|uniref:hypothetical protein n=1 Tax=Planctomicrobium sp. SH527 TaxID=3448123 RepID=UPI003F5C0D41
MSELDRILREQNAAILAMLQRIEGLERKLTQLETESCPAAVRATAQIMAAKAFPEAYASSSVIDNFELLHQSVLDAIQ